MAIGAAAAGLILIDDCRLKAVALQRQRCRHSDDAGTDHHGAAPRPGSPCRRTHAGTLARTQPLISRPFARAGSWSAPRACPPSGQRRSEEHTSELQSLMRISYAVFCLKKKI